MDNFNDVKTLLQKQLGLLYGKIMAWSRDFHHHGYNSADKKG